MNTLRIAAVVTMTGLMGACGQKAEQAAPVAAEPQCTPAAVAEPQSVEIAPGLSSKRLTEGCGEAAVNGQTAVVHYTGWLLDLDAANGRGSKFDSSRDRGQHFEFPLGAGRVIQGWDRGVVGMLRGEMRELTIAPELAYGDRGVGTIPPGSTLVFEVELVDLKGGAVAAPVPADTTE